VREGGEASCALPHRLLESKSSWRSSETAVQSHPALAPTLPLSPRCPRPPSSTSPPPTPLPPPLSLEYTSQSPQTHLQPCRTTQRMRSVPLKQQGVRLVLVPSPTQPTLVSRWSQRARRRARSRGSTSTTQASTREGVEKWMSTRMRTLRRKLGCSTLVRSHVPIPQLRSALTLCSQSPPRNTSSTSSPTKTPKILSPKPQRPVRSPLASPSTTNVASTAKLASRTLLAKRASRTATR
jgi:hypothetical protein